MQSLTRFQVVLLAIFGFFIIAGVISFATYQGSNSENNPPITIWGVIPENVMRRALEEPVVRANKLQITYLYKDKETLDVELTEALAEGKGPDAIIIPQSFLHKEKPKLSPISYDVISAREYKNTFIESAESLMDEMGIWGIPLTIDPLVLYWNRTSFTNAGIAEPPRTWDQIANITDKLVKKDSVGNLRGFSIALGEYSNVNHAKEILSNMIIQNGNSISFKNQSGSVNISLFGDGVKTAEAVAFYTSFADPVRPNYSWNRAQKNSANVFAEGSLSMYIGFGSELNEIAEKNPNLNFDITLLPQLKDMPKSTFGSLNFIAIPRQSKNPGTALITAKVLGSKDIIKTLSDASGLPPSRRDLLTSSPDNPYAKILYDSALIAKVWEDPDPKKSKLVFKELIETVTSGRTSVSESLSVADQELQNLIRNE